VTLLITGVGRCSLKNLDPPAPAPKVPKLREEGGESLATASPALDASAWTAFSHFADTVLKPPGFFQSGAR
jgi:hypothetical protein